MKVKNVPVALIVGNGNRKNLGCIDKFAAELAETLLINPILVRRRGKHYELLAGSRRLAAWRLNAEKYPEEKKWRTIPAHVYEGQLSAAALAQSENDWRENLPLSDQLALLKAIATEEAKKAKQRQKAGKPASAEEKGKTAAKVARQARGWSTTKYERIKAIDDAARKNPEKYGTFRDQMDRTGRYFNAWEQLQDAKQAERLKVETQKARGPKHSKSGHPFLLYGQPSKEQLLALRDMGLTCFHLKGGEA